MSKLGGILVRMSLATAVAAAAAVTPTALAGGDAPPVKSLRTVPAPVRFPAGVPSAIAATAAHIHMAPDTAIKRTRMLMSDVTGLPLYAFSGAGNQVCFLVGHEVAVCGVLDSRHPTIWAVNGGSRRRGQAVVGVVSDRVRAVTVVVDGHELPVRLRNNGFVATFRTPANRPASHVAVVARTR